MGFKRVIPKVGVAALTLGGGAAAFGCSSDDATGSQDPVESFCNKLAECGDIDDTTAAFNECVEGRESYIADEASYYGEECERAIRQALACVGGLSCHDLLTYSDDFEECFEDVYQECN
jgi:hypothetical protein